MTQGLEDPHLAFLMRHLSHHWHIETMVGLLQLEQVMAGWCSMMFVENHSLLLFFMLMVVQRQISSLYKHVLLLYAHKQHQFSVLKFFFPNNKIKEVYIQCVNVRFFVFFSNAVSKVWYVACVQYENEMCDIKGREMGNELLL